MSSLTRWLSLAAVLVLAVPGAARARSASDAPVQPPDTASLRTEPQAPLTQQEGQLPPAAAPAAQAPEANGAILDGHLRYGAFLSGPGSLTFILHHSLMGALGGFFTQGFANGFSFERSSARPCWRARSSARGSASARRRGGSSTTGWTSRMGNFGIGNSVIGGMFPPASWTCSRAIRPRWPGRPSSGAELGAWLTATITGGQLPLDARPAGGLGRRVGPRLQRAAAGRRPLLRHEDLREDVDGHAAHGAGHRRDGARASPR